MQRNVENGKKSSKKLSNTEAEPLPFENHLLFSFSLSSKRAYSKICATNKSTYFSEIVRLIIIERKGKKKKRSHRHYINRPRPWHGHRHSEY